MNSSSTNIDISTFWTSTITPRLNCICCAEFTFIFTNKLCFNWCVQFTYQILSTARTRSFWCTTWDDGILIWKNFITFHWHGNHAWRSPATRVRLAGYLGNWSVQSPQWQDQTWAATSSRPAARHIELFVWTAQLKNVIRIADSAFKFSKRSISGASLSWKRIMKLR